MNIRSIQCHSCGSNLNAEVQIPPRFRQEKAVEYIIKGLKAREFITMEQAIFKCEEAMTRGEIRDDYI